MPNRDRPRGLRGAERVNESALMKRLSGFAVTVALAAVAAPAHAGVIVPQHGINGVRVGQTERTVLARLGPPVQIRRGSNEFGRYQELRYRGLTVSMQGGRRVTSVTTRSSVHRTRSGVGVGTTLAVLKTKVHGVQCTTFSGIRHCVVGVEEAGRQVTAFLVRRGRVRVVTVGIVID